MRSRNASELGTESAVRRGTCARKRLSLESAASMLRRTTLKHMLVPLAWLQVKLGRQKATGHPDHPRSLSRSGLDAKMSRC